MLMAADVLALLVIHLKIFRQNDSPKLKFKKENWLYLCFFYSSLQGSCLKKFNPFCNHGADGEEMKCTLSNNEDNNIVMCQIWHKMIFLYIKCDIFRNNILFYFGTSFDEKDKIYFENLINSDQKSTSTQIYIISSLCRHEKIIQNSLKN